MTLTALALLPKSASLPIASSFVVFAIFNSGSSVLQWVYPSGLFPTEVRATALGFATAVSRIGAALGTFLVPSAIDRIGIGALMLVFAGVCVVGLLAAMRLAPETKGVSLAAASEPLHDG